MLRRLLPLAILLVLACHGPSEPESPFDSIPRGRLSGIVTIGPNCPNDNPANPCPTQPDHYRERKVLVYNEAKTTLLHTVDIDGRGAYLIDLRAGTYTIDARLVRADTTADVPKVVTIQGQLVTRVDIKIDTGIR